MNVCDRLFSAMVSKKSMEMAWLIWLSISLSFSSEVGLVIELLVVCGLFPWADVDSVTTCWLIWLFIGVSSKDGLVAELLGVSGLSS